MTGYVECYTPGEGRTGKSLCQLVAGGNQLNLWSDQESYENSRVTHPNGSEGVSKPSSIIIAQEDGFLYVMVGSGVSGRPLHMDSNDPYCIPGYSPELGCEVAVWTTPTPGAEYIVFSSLAQAIQNLPMR